MSQTYTYQNMDGAAYQRMQDLLGKPIHLFDLPSRALDAIEDMYDDTLPPDADRADLSVPLSFLVGMKASDLAGRPGVGLKTVNLVRTALARLGLAFRGEEMQPTSSYRAEDVRNWGVGDYAFRFPTRAVRVFVRAGINHMGQLLETTAEDLLMRRNMGIGTLEEVRQILRKHGLYLKGEDPRKGCVSDCA